MPRVRTGFLVEFGALKDYIGKSRNQEAAKTWVRVKKYIESGAFSLTRYDGDLASLVMAGYDDKYIAEKFGIQMSTVRGHRRSIGNALYNVLGDDFCSLFYQYDDNKEVIAERIKGFDTVGIRSIDLLPSEIVLYPKDSVPLAKYELFDCLSELSFLEKHSLASIRGELRGLDVSKLKYLLAVIDEKTGSFSERSEVIKNMIMGEDSGNVQL